MLQIQVHIKMPKPGPGIAYSRDLLDAIAERWLKGEKLPARVQVTAIEWGTGKLQKIERDPRRILRVREDFRFIPFEFTTTSRVSALGGN